MTLKAYFTGMIVSTILCFFSLLLIIYYIDIEVAGFIGLILFFLILFLFLSSFFALWGFCFKRRFLKKKIKFEQIEISFRQGALLSLVFTGILILQSWRMLFWWSTILFIISVCLLEFYFLNKD